MLVARDPRTSIDAVVRAVAAAYPDPTLRSFDAIHLATAQAVFNGQITAFITYDEQLARAAGAGGLTVAAPS